MWRRRRGRGGSGSRGCGGELGALDDARTGSQRRWQRDDHRRARLRGRIRSLDRKLLAKLVPGREQEGEQPGLTACDAVRRRKSTAVLDAEDGAAQRDRDVAVLAAAYTWEQRQSRQCEADPQQTRERRRRGKSPRLEGRQKPRSHRGPCGCLPPILHVPPTAVLASQTSAIAGSEGVPHPRE